MAKTYNTIPTVSTGDVYTATAHNNIVENVNNYRVPPMARAQINQDVSGSGNDTALALISQAAVDCTITAGTAGTTISSAGRITVDTDGIYLVTWSIVGGANGSAQRRTAGIAKNGTGSALNADTVMWAEVTASTSVNITMSAAGLLSLVQGDYLTPVVYQNSGVDVTWGTVGAASYLHVQWVGQAS